MVELSARRQAPAPPAGFVELSTTTHETAASGLTPSIADRVQIGGRRARFVELVAYSDRTATQRCTDGHETSLPAPAASTCSEPAEAVPTASHPPAEGHETALRLALYALGGVGSACPEKPDRSQDSASAVVLSVLAAAVPTAVQASGEEHETEDSSVSAELGSGSARQPNPFQRSAWRDCGASPGRIRSAER